jgi:exopolysaccharide production protein ExoQ
MHGESDLVCFPFQGCKVTTTGIRMLTTSHTEPSVTPSRRVSRAEGAIHRSTPLADLLLMIWLVICSGAIFPLLEAGCCAYLSPESMERLRWLIVPNLIAAPLLTLLRGRAVLSLLLRHPTLVLLVSWVWLSVLWSIDPALSARRALSFTANTMIACFVVTFFRPEEIVRKLLFVAMGLILLSLVFRAIRPDLALQWGYGDFRGVMFNKNQMGGLLIVAAMLLAAAGCSRLVSPLTAAGGFAIVAALLVPTHSATATLFVLLVGILHLPLAIASLPRRMVTIGLTYALLSGLALALPFYLGKNRLIMAIGRDPTLTGRSELWAFVRGLIDQRPLHGYGYEAFFDSDVPGFHEHLEAQLLALVGWLAPNAHSGYLEVWLGLGLVGLVLTLVFLLGAFVRAARVLIRDPKSVPACFAFFCLSAGLFRNISESDLLAQSGWSWILMVLAALMVRVHPLPVRRPALRGTRGTFERGGDESAGEDR